MADGLEGLEALDAGARERPDRPLQSRDGAGSAFQGYGRPWTSASQGASEAARRGAVASLVRSVGTLDARLAHTGAVTYEEGVAADSRRRHRGGGRRPDRAPRRRAARRPRCGCASGAGPCPTRRRPTWWPSCAGRERPDEIVLIGAHLDSWDLGTGAHDDGAGVAMVMEALRILKALGLDAAPHDPRRAVHERGERPARRQGLRRRPRRRAAAARGRDRDGQRRVRAPGLHANVDAAGPRDAAARSPRRSPPSARRASRAGGGGADIAPMRPARVPLLGLDVDGAHYFDWHHTPADTLDKVDPADLARATAAMAAMAYLLAEMPQTLPRPVPSPSPSPLAAMTAARPRAPCVARRHPRRRSRGGRGQGLRARRAAPGGAAGAGRLRGPARLSRRRRAGPRPARRWAGRSRCARPRLRRTAPTRASPASSGPSSTSRGAERRARGRGSLPGRRRFGARLRAGDGDASPAARSRCSCSGSSSPRAAGVAFTRHPLDPSAMLVEAHAGRGDAVVSGAVTPDRYTIDRATSAVREAPARSLGPSDAGRGGRAGRRARRRTSARRRTWSGRSAPRARCCCSRGRSPWPRRRPWTRGCATSPAPTSARSCPVP